MDYMQRIKALRVKNNYTQVQLSRLLGLSPSAYGLYETYQRQMDIESLIKICRLFHASADDILGLSCLSEKEKTNV